MDISLIGDMFSIKHSVDYHVEKEDYHVHGDYEILFPVFGSVSFCAENHHYNLQPGMIMVIPPGVRHRYDKKNKNIYERMVLLMKPPFFLKLQKLSGFENGAELDTEQLIQIDSVSFEKLYGVLTELEHSLKSEDYSESPLGQAYLMQVLIFLNHEYLKLEHPKESSQCAGTFSRIAQIRQFIDKNLCENLSLEDVANQFNISKFYLAHEFKKAYQISLHQYIRRQRLKAAGQYLSRNGSVNGAFVVSGFTDYANFSKAFKQEFGCSPREYRKNFLGKE